MRTLALSSLVVCVCFSRWAECAWLRAFVPPLQQPRLRSSSPTTYTHTAYSNQVTDTSTEERGPRMAPRPPTTSTSPSNKAARAITAAALQCLLILSQFQFLGMGVYEARATVNLQVDTRVQQPLVDEVWEIVNKNFVDRSFHGAKWDQVREEFHEKQSKGEDPKRLIRQMVRRLSDKYSRVVDEKTFVGLTKFDPIGVGVLFMTPSPGSYLEISAPPFAGSSAEKAGLKKGDAIIAINGLDTRDLFAIDVMRMVSASDSSTLLLTVKPQEGEKRDVTLERVTMKFPTKVQYYAQDLKKSTNGQKHSIGYVRIGEWTQDTNTAVRQAVADLKSQGVDAFALDLRGNPGGGFQFALDVGGVFMKDRVMVTVEDRDGGKSAFKTNGEVLTDLPLVTLTDRGSASASEVFVGGMQDNCRSAVFGDRTYGKGLIQGIFGLSDGEGLILTVAKFLTPNGRQIQGEGLHPDVSKVQLPLPPIELPVGPMLLKPDLSGMDYDEVVASMKMCMQRQDVAVAEPFISSSQ